MILRGHSLIGISVSEQTVICLLCVIIMGCVIEKNKVTLTYRGDKLRERYQYKKNFQNKKTPYWNFWRAVFAGWLIRYPEKFFGIVKFPLYLLLGIVVVYIYNRVG